MRIPGAAIPYAPNAVSSVPKHPAVGPENEPAKAIPVNDQPRSSVSISGQALLRQRIFYGGEPMYRSTLPAGMSRALYTSPNDFLTRQDCDLLSQVYAFAQESGADLKFVDSLAFDLGSYRWSDNGRIMNPHNRGHMFDREGHMVSYAFSDNDAATVKRILTSDALKTTQLDQGFIRFKTDIGYAANTFTHYEFMEQVINKFSAQGADVPPLDTRFSRREYNERTGVEHLSTEVYVPGPNGRPVRKGTAAAAAATNANDPNTVLGKNKKNALNTKPETIQDIFRRVMAKAFASGWGIRVRSLAEFLMKSGR